jgi:predicted DNA-binding protein
VAADKDRALTVRLPETLHEQLRERAEAEERTIASLLRMAAKQYLNSSSATA